jgi:hypothetical protein
MEMFQLKCATGTEFTHAMRGAAILAHNHNGAKGWRMPILLSSLLCFVFVGWMAAKIWKRSAMLAILTLFLWPVSAFAVLRYWGDELSDIKVPFLFFLPAFAYTLYG